MYGGLTAAGKPAEPDAMTLAKRLVHFDFKKAGLVFADQAQADKAAEMIGRLIEQEVERAVGARGAK